MKLAIVIKHKGERRTLRVAIGGETTGETLKVGRAWDSDVLLDDRFVNEQHLELSVVDGELFVRDLDSRNGTLLAGKPLKGEPQKLSFGQVLLVGDTQIRVNDAQAAVPPASLRSAWYFLVERFGSVKMIMTLTAIALLLEVLVVWLSSQEDYGLGDAAVALGTMLLGLTVSVFILGLISKLLRNEMSLKAHWLILVIGSIVFILVDQLLQVLRFNLQMPELSDAIRTAAMSGMAIVFLVGLLSYATHLGPTKKMVWSILTVGMILVLSFSEDWLKEDHQRWASYSNAESISLPPALLFRPTVSVAEYFDGVDDVFEFTPTELSQDDG